MVMYEVHVHPLLQRYKTHLCTFATVFNIITIGLTYIPPLLIAYLSQGFWLKESTYREQPEVHFKHEFVLLLQGTALNSLIAYSTYQNFNNLMANSVRIPFVQSYEEDNNRDGKKDMLNFEIQIPLKDTESVHSVQLILIFDYKLHRFSTLQMESMAYIFHESPIAGSEFYTEGDLKLKQKYLLPNKGRYTTYNVAVVNSGSIYVDDYDFSKIFARYLTRNVSTNYISHYPVWKGGRAAGSPFVLKGRIHYPEETIIYRPGFWQLIKVAWIQYLAILFIFLYLFNRIRRGIFENQILTTVPQKVPINLHGS